MTLYEFVGSVIVAGGISALLTFAIVTLSSGEVHTGARSALVAGLATISIVALVTLLIAAGMARS